MAGVWKAGSKSAHLTGEGMAQAGANDAGIYHVGPTFSLPLAVTSFSTGLYTSYRLTREALWVLRRDAEGAPETANTLSDVVDDAMASLAKLRSKHAKDV